MFINVWYVSSMKIFKKKLHTYCICYFGVFQNGENCQIRGWMLLFVCFLREVDLAIQGARLLQKLWTAKVKIEFSWELKRHFSPTLRRIRDWKMRSYQRGPKFCKIRIFANFFFLYLKHSRACRSIGKPRENSNFIKSLCPTFDTTTSFSIWWDFT